MFARADRELPQMAAGGQGAAIIANVKRHAGGPYADPSDLWQVISGGGAVRAVISASYLRFAIAQMPGASRDGDE
jgi:hypothetical protein